MLGGGGSHRSTMLRLAGERHSAFIHDPQYKKLNKWAKTWAWYEEVYPFEFKKDEPELEKWLSEKESKAETREQQEELYFLRLRFEDIKKNLRNIMLQWVPCCIRFKDPEKKEDKVGIAKTKPDKSPEPNEVTRKEEFFQDETEMVTLCDHTNDNLTLAGTKAYEQRQIWERVANIQKRVHERIWSHTFLFLKAHEMLSMVKPVCKNWNSVCNKIFDTQPQQFRFIFFPQRYSVLDMNVINIRDLDFIGWIKVFSPRWVSPENILWMDKKVLPKIPGLIRYSIKWQNRFIYQLQQTKEEENQDCQNKMMHLERYLSCK